MFWPNATATASPPNVSALVSVDSPGQCVRQKVGSVGKGKNA